MEYRGFSYEQALNKKPGVWRLQFPDGSKVYTDQLTEEDLKKSLDELIAKTPGHIDPP